MNLKSFREYCNSFPGVEEDFPFDETTLVFKVKSKMFALTNVSTFELISVKCEPEYAILLREKYEDVIPGYYLNKQHWNSVIMNNSINDDLLKEWIENSYRLVVKKLPKRLQKELII